MTNFDFLKNESQFYTFADAAIAAEKNINIDTATCALNCRRAMEYAIKWMYSVDSQLSKPYDERLVSLMSSDDFRDMVNSNILKQMDYIRKKGNKAAHTNKNITYDEAELCLRNLFAFLDFVAYCYAKDYEEREFNPELLKQSDAGKVPEMPSAFSLDELIKENAALKEELTARREEQSKSYTPKPELSEFKTRKIYIDTLLEDAGWSEGQNWINEVPLEGMPNASEIGYADYVLYDDTQKPLAIIEAKRTCVDVSKGRQQAKLYADIIEKKYGRRPVIFLSNGFDTRIIDGEYPERRVAAFYSKRDLEKLFNLRNMRESLKYVNINSEIAGRYYQEAAIKATCEALENKKRKALLVMATGSGKTRTVIALCDVLMKRGWVRNVLFLADRTSLVTQAKRSFTNLMPNTSSVNLCGSKEKDYNARIVFSTYQTMMNCIDTINDENEKKLFTCGHFDLVICDEAHRSIYNKYKDIFNYFDAPLVGLTATPKDEIDKNTYEVFDLEDGVPTYGYDLTQAVTDGYLVDYISVETKLKFIEEGIIYEELSQDEKEEYEATFSQEDGKIPERIQSAKLNEWVFNEDTIKQVLHILMSEGLKVNYGEKIGKTIIFAKNHNHAEKIFEIFNKEYPKLNGYAMVIDNYINYAQSAIDEFSDPKKLPQIAISVDMLDTGIDVPEILNLVFFKKVMSKAKFWQMIGRGTRLCERLIDGIDKSKFYIFDFCGNFEFFRMNEGRATSSSIALQGAIFNLKTQMIYKLQEAEYQTDYLMPLRKTLVDDSVGKVKELNRNNFAVRQHLRYVDKYAEPAGYNGMNYEDTLIIKEEVAPLILPDDDEAEAMRFDALMYSIELAQLAGKKHSRGINDLLKKAESLSKIANIPEIISQIDLIDKIIHTSYLEEAKIVDFEYIRENLRNLMKYINKGPATIYQTNFEDDILSMEWNEAELENSMLDNYKAKVEFYIRQNQDKAVIAKLRTNQPLTRKDVMLLEDILWRELGTKNEYREVYGEKPLGELVREIVGMDMNAAKDAFARYLDPSSMNSNQIYFVNQIIEYIIHNGVMKDLSVLQETPFSDRGSIIEIFSDTSVWMGVKSVIDQINDNAIA